MRLYLSPGCPLKLLETPSVYDIGNDELYELDREGFEFLRRCSSADGCEAAESEFAGHCLGEGILTTERVNASRPPLRQSLKPSLRYLELQITRRCNLRCGHCYLGPPDEKELPVEDVVRALADFERMQGLRVLITGGEPLMHGRFREINDALPRFALRKVLFTNGLSVTEETLRGLNVEEIQVSVDGLEKAHDALRGKGTFKRAMGCIGLALGAGLDVSVSTMVHRENLEDFEKMEKLFMETGIRDWTVDVPCVEGNLRENPAFRLSPGEAGSYLRYGFGDGLHGGGEGFACGRHLMAVMADGTCAKCSFYAGAPVGRLDEGLGKCWERVPHMLLDDLECDCDVLDTCRGGCRYRAGLAGSPRGKDLYRCQAYGKL